MGIGWIYPWINKKWLKHYHYRNGPVPGIHCYRASSHYMRCPRNHGEKRNACGTETDHGNSVKLRAKRKSRLLVDDRDDFLISCHKNRSWKNYRLTRYKTK